MDWKNSIVVKNCIDEYIRILKNNYTQEQYNSELIDINKSLMCKIYNEFLKLWSNDDLLPIISILKILDDKYSKSSDQSNNILNEYSVGLDHLINAKDKEINLIRP